MGDRRRRRLVDEAAGAETIEGEGRADGMRLACRDPALHGIDPHSITYYFRRVMVIPNDKIPGMAVWRKSLFAMMHLNANLPAAYFGVPAAQVVEVGLEVVWLTNVVNRGEVEQQIEGEFGIVAQDAQSRNDLLARDVNPIIAQRVLVFGYELAQAPDHLLQKRRECGGRGRRFAVVISGHNGGADNRCGS